MATGDILGVRAVEGSTYVLTVKFYDEDGSDVTPTSIKWTLTSEDGSVINSRSNIEIDPPAQTVQVVLQGADLPAPGMVFFAVSATYNSTLGTGLPLKEQVRIRVSQIMP